MPPPFRCHWARPSSQENNSQAPTGIIKVDASILTALKVLITTNTASSQKVITANAQPGRCNPKYTQDQQTPSNNCNAHQASGMDARPRIVSHTIQADTAINTYNTAQTEAISMAGGFHEG